MDDAYDSTSDAPTGEYRKNKRYLSTAFITPLIVGASMVYVDVVLESYFTRRESEPTEPTAKDWGEPAGQGKPVGSDVVAIDGPGIPGLKLAGVPP